MEISGTPSQTAKLISPIVQYARRDTMFRLHQDPAGSPVPALHFRMNLHSGLNGRHGRLNNLSPILAFQAIPGNRYRRAQ
jgi:hypothetical protein